MSRFRRNLWLYPLFQIPLLFLIGCLVAASLFWLLGLGRPNVAVTIALDLSTSTYTDQPFNAPGTILYQEVEAVRVYLKENSQLKVANKIQVLGFGGSVQSLTGDFNGDNQQVETRLSQALKNPALPQLVSTHTTNINAAIQHGVDTLSKVSGHCRELLLVTDGGASVSPKVVADAVVQKVRINTILVGADSSELRLASITTNGTYIPTSRQVDLRELFVDKFFLQFNSNLKWILVWLGCAWVAFVWLLTLPLDQWILQGLMKLPMHLSGQLALGNALFWSIATPLILWRLLQMIGLRFFSPC